ncbi:hypothetical protein DRI50_03420 [candidate division KSB1 bacterium]|nr:MAG: hypothetical protein DRI50_03420 [candidate division KSB1 bacterium]
MAKHKVSEKKKAHAADKKHAEDENQYPEKVEKLYKRIMRILSWTVGVAFVLIIVLPEFNSSVLDQITRVIYLIGISSLLVFIIIEFFSSNMKNLLRRIIHA